MQGSEQKRSRAVRACATVRDHRRLVAIGATVLLMLLLLSAVAPTPAEALFGLPSPGKVISTLLGGLGSAIGGTVGKLAVTAFDAIVHALFAPIAHFINTQLIGWLVAVPDYAPPGSHVAATEWTVLAMAGAALGAVATISIARFWAAGLAGSGGSALEGLARTVGAALFLPLWPWVFHTAVGLANAASTGLLGSGSVTKASANLLAVGVGAGVGLGFLGLGLFVSIVMAVVASILFLGLLLMKVVLAVSTVLVFIGMPIAVVLWPAVGWIPRAVARAFMVCLAVPLVWAMCFAASGALLNDAIFLKGSSGFFDALLEPLAAIALLWLMLALPARLAQMAMLGAGAVTGGFVRGRSATRRGRSCETPPASAFRAGRGVMGTRASNAREGRTPVWALGSAARASWPPARRRVARRGPEAPRPSGPRRVRAPWGTARATVRASSSPDGLVACAALQTRAGTRRRRWRAGRARFPGAGCSGRAGARRTSTPRCWRPRCVSSTDRCRPNRPSKRATPCRRPRGAPSAS